VRAPLAAIVDLARPTVARTNATAAAACVATKDNLKVAAQWRSIVNGQGVLSGGEVSVTIRFHRRSSNDGSSIRYLFALLVVVGRKDSRVYREIVRRLPMPD